MEPLRIQWSTQSYKLDSLPVSSQRCVNLYAEKEPPDAKTDIAVIASPGIITLVTVGNGPIRGFSVMNNVLYLVSGQSLYSVTVADTVTELGSGIAGFGPVSMANNGTQVQIVNGVAGWIYAPTSVFNVSAATPVGGSSGSDYAIGDQITVAGGTYTNPAILEVATLSGSAAASFTIYSPGQYGTEPTNPAEQAATTGVGSGASFNLTFTGPPVGFSQIPNFADAATTTFFDTYFTNDVTGTNQWVYSNNNDGTTYTALDYNEASVDSSYVLATVNQQENLLIFKQKTIETWYDTGANNDPFSRYDGATIERGCAAALAIVKEDNGVFFLGNDLVFYRLDGVLLRRMSTHAIEGAWQKYANTGDAYAFSYTFNGHKFVAVQFPSNNATWELDIATSLWHERTSYVAATPFDGAWRGNCSVVFNNQTLIGDSQSGQIGYLSDSVYTEFGSPMIGFADSPPVHKDRKRVFISKLELNMQVGDAPQTGQGSDPQIMLMISKDQGRTYGIRQLWMSLGKTGAYATRLIWKKLGAARDWRFRIVVSDPVPRTFIAAYATADIEEV
jgi:hypothetical protein